MVIPRFDSLKVKVAGQMPLKTAARQNMPGECPLKYNPIL